MSDLYITGNAYNISDLAIIHRIESLLVSDSVITEMVFSYNRIQDSWMTILSDALKVNKTLIGVHFHSCMVSVTGMFSLASALTVNTTLTHLNLSDNNFGDEGITALAEALTVNTTLQKISLSQCRINSVGMDALKKALIVNNSIDDISFRGNNPVCISSKIAEVLKVNTSLQCIDLGMCSIHSSGMITLAETLKENKTIQSIMLCYNGIDPDGIDALASALAVNRTLKKLDIDSNNSGPVGFRSLADALKENTTLQEINIKSNGLCDIGVVAIADMLKVNTSLRVLQLGYNQCKHIGIIALAESLKINATLRELDITIFNSLGTMVWLQEAMVVNTALVVFETHSGHNHLGEYLLRNKGLAEACIQEVNVLMFMGKQQPEMRDIFFECAVQRLAQGPPRRDADTVRREAFEIMRNIR